MVAALCSCRTRMISSVSVPTGALTTSWPRSARSVTPFSSNRWISSAAVR